jgi:serine/threonine protein kinase
MKCCPTCQRTFADDKPFCLFDGTPLQPVAEPLPGQVLDGRYQLLERLGQGSMGVVYKAQHVRLLTPSAIKIFRPDLLANDPELATRLEQEIRKTATLRHPNIVALTDYGVADGRPFIVMEFVQGRTLAAVLAREGRCPTARALELICTLGDAVAAAHEAGLVYCDLKPTNVMLADDLPLRAAVKLLDINLVQLKWRAPLEALSSGPAAGMVGSPFYLAPEQWRGAAPDQRTDVYALGVLLYQLLTGELPFNAPTLPALMTQQLSELPPRLSEIGAHISVDIERVLRRALAQEPDLRTQTVEAFTRELVAAGYAAPVELNSFEQSVAAATDAQPDEARVTGELKRETQEPTTPLYADENVQFTVYRPEVIAPERWYKLLAFAHLSERRPDAPPDEPDPSAEVARMAAHALADEPARYSSLRQDSLYAVPHKGELRFVPFVEGCEFNPPSQSFFWLKRVHKVEFELVARSALDGRLARGRLSVFLGALLLADVPLALRIDSRASATTKAQPTVAASAQPYRKIFASYSHKDRLIVEQIEHHIKTLGDKYLRDVTELRAGQDWQHWMKEAIEQADVFQLFWSHNAMRSAYVQQEWEYALALARPDFIRPTYWETPLPESPAENLPPAELRRLHFQHLQPDIATHPTTPIAVNASALPTVIATPMPTPTPHGITAQVESAVRCQSCGAANRGAARFCVKCGRALINSAVPQPAARPQSSQPIMSDTMSDTVSVPAGQYQSAPLPMIEPPQQSANFPSPRQSANPIIWLALAAGLLLFLIVCLLLVYLFLR